MFKFVCLGFYKCIHSEKLIVFEFWFSIGLSEQSESNKNKQNCDIDNKKANI